ncbi:hypothetical protein EV193_11629 [Herbihabitans rhizosphaerae]|uniref:Phosphotransferase family enzyme n=1 Tax=Herbihabitans rhizosphaerae TaxID=1872711 RepID=A0A4Q7KDR5_9PSEU|nr:hypothetical protein EV193_11629 [Herbihabitans rhizosphaerae]
MIVIEHEERLIKRTEQLLGQQVELVANLSFSSRATVLRLRVAGGSTVIVKQHVSEARFHNEKLALTSLPTSISPELITASNGIVIMEDVGDGPSVANLLLANDAAAARNALQSWASSLGKIASHTADEPFGSAVSKDFEHCMRAHADLSKLWEVPLAGAQINELRRIVTSLKTPGPYHILTVSDAACPDNNRVTADGTVRLFDFEYAQRGHAAVDAAYILAPFCSCWCVAPMPSPVTDHMYAAYSAEYPKAQSQEFRNLSIAAAVVLILPGLLRSSIKALEGVTTPQSQPPYSALQRCYLRLDWLSNQDAVAPEFAYFARRLQERVAHRIAIPDISTYPAFVDC